MTASLTPAARTRVSALRSRVDVRAAVGVGPPQVRPWAGDPCARAACPRAARYRARRQPAVAGRAARSRAPRTMAQLPSLQGILRPVAAARTRPRRGGRSAPGTVKKKKKKKTPPICQDREIPYNDGRFALFPSAMLVSFGHPPNTSKEEDVTKSGFVDQVSANSGLSRRMPAMPSTRSSRRSRTR